MEAPRVSGTLRAALCGDASDMDVAKLLAARERVLKGHLHRAAVEAAGGAGSLSWGSFVEGLEEPDDAVLRAQRKCYNAFLADLQALVGDETASAELHESAYVVFNTLAESGQSEQAKQASLARLLRVDSLPKAAVASLQAQVSTLHEWRAALQRAQGGNARDGTNTNAAKAVVREFGRDLLFALDAPDFLSRAPVKVSKAPEVVRFEASADPRPQPVLVPAARAAAPSGNWLEEECARVAAASSSRASDVYASVVALAKSAPSTEALQGQLFDLLGVDGLELMERVVSQWSSVKAMGDAATAPSLSAGGAPPTTGSVSVTLERDKKGQQRRRKQELKAARQQQQQMQPDDAQPDLARLKQVVESSDRAALPAVERSGYIAGGTARMAETKFVMPEGAKRVDTPEFESVWLPPKRPPYRPDDSLVPVASLEPWAQPAFKGFTTLNRIQSTVFQTAFHSNENMLICAPTGAGKTNIAMITILRVLSLNRSSDGRVLKDQFKIVYVAPMKALASEMTDGFSKRLAFLGIKVRELTGDMQLTKQEIEETQIIVTTPEKWDVITRKSTDSPLTALVHLLILDEVHLLNEDRGPVIETLVARTLRQVEATQSMIRIVGLSATLPNYKDVAQFMRVNETTGLYFFDGSYRPVPLEQTFVGVKGKGMHKQREHMTKYCYDAALKTLKSGKQCMVFVHSRKDTLKTALDLLQLAEDNGTAALFSEEVNHGKDAEWAKREIAKSRNQDLKRLFPAGFACHHAGMLRSDRNLVEKMFHMGLVRVLCCTATLAWGVNLPCKQVIIKGTSVYNADKGAFCQLGMLDVMQIFGRAGRPQFDDEGSAIMITTIDELYRYLALTSHQAPIESQFTHELVDNLNAEIVLGTVTNVQEAVTWLSYTYLHVRMMRNPMVYGIGYDEVQLDANLVQKRTELIVAAAQELDDVRMIRFNNPYFSSTNMGQTASYFYINHETIRTFNEAFEKKANAMQLKDVLHLVCTATEFDNITTREEELNELDKLKKSAFEEIPGDAAGDKSVKVNILLQAYIRKMPVTAFALVCDTNYIAQNSARIVRGLFEIALRKGLPDAASMLLKLCKMIDLRLWDKLHPLRQFPQLKDALVFKLEQRELTVDRLLEMEVKRDQGRDASLRFSFSFFSCSLRKSAPSRVCPLQPRVSWPAASRYPTSKWKPACSQSREPLCASKWR